MNQAYVLDYVRTARGRATPRGACTTSARSSWSPGCCAPWPPAPRPRRRRGAGRGAGLRGPARRAGREPGAHGGAARGLGDGVPGVVVNRFCASGIEAVAVAASRIRAGDASLLVAGGVESASRAPAVPLWTDASVVRQLGAVHIGVAADLNATIDGFDRPALDAYAAESHRKAASASRAGAFARSLVPVGGLAHDELIRPDTTVETLAALPPAYAALGADGQDALALSTRAWPERVEHLHTAGTSPRPPTPPPSCSSATSAPPTTSA
ncbi:beta-ketoacyl synthase N-terminal-like domain-containing protein [Actinokineospora soli]|uniref:Beta-ketoacyl synthase N-terminal-like domain-containing protein n=1 Tax=Actinokineospora soli TaxID=1048753 RepID=A0ABW2TLZ1_9PSEU